MKPVQTVILSFFFFCLCASCSRNLSNEVWVVSEKKHFRNGTLSLKDPAEAIRFSEDFWSYFIQTHPRSSAVLFLNHLYPDYATPFSTGDSSRAIFAAGIFHEHLFNNLLADKAGNPEKEDWISGSFFVINEEAASGTTHISKPVARQLEPRVAKEFDRLKSILTGKDTTGPYIFVYRKNFLDH